MPAHVEPGWYTAMFVMLLICVVVAPASALFRIAPRSRVRQADRDGDANGLKALQTDLPVALRAELREEKRPVAMIDRMVKTRAETLSRLPALAPFDAMIEPAPHILLAPFGWADAVLPIENDAAARVRYGGEWSYMPTVPWLSFSAWGWLALFCALALLTWWMRWKAVRLFFADQDTTPPENMSPPLLWGRCTREERFVLIRVAHDHVANPYRTESTVESLMKQGLLTLNPDLQPCSAEFADFIVAQQGNLQTELDQWAAVDSGHSWRYARLVLLTSTAGLGLFVIATQPGVQAGLVGLGGGIAGVLTAAVKLRDSVLEWSARSRSLDMAHRLSK